MRFGLALCTALLVLGAASRAFGFCGFFVSGAGDALYNNATQVALMRDGNRTIISMANNYQGPPEDFALVVPVPVVLQKENVRTLPKEVFEHLDQLAAPRLVEYWEQDPCMEREHHWLSRAKDEMDGARAPAATGGSGPAVRVEAEFAVGEYEVVILSADDATALDGWLRDNGYKIPAGAEPYLRPYVQGGSKFFVAKVNVKKVAMKDGMAMLSPLRFYYDSETFSLPIRLGLLNANEAQDLIIHILARNERYDVANYPNETIPTNIEVSDEVRERFGEFYAALFDKVLEAHPKAVVTEYAWGTSSCDPCPTPPLGDADLTLLGADVIPSVQAELEKRGAQLAGGDRPNMPPGVIPFDFVVTRLHARYSKETAGEDLVFRRANHIVGGRELGSGKLDTSASPQPHGISNFQGRYIIRHPWQGAVNCPDPVFGVWGAPPGEDHGIHVARDLAFVPRGKITLAELVAGAVPDIDLVGRYTPPTRSAPSWYAKFMSVPRIAALMAVVVLLFAGATFFVKRRRPR